MNINKILAMNIDSFINYFNNNINESDKFSLLCDYRIKEKIINESYVGFFNFCENIQYKYLEVLLDSEGLKLLDATDNICRKLNAILFNFKNTSTLFEREDFCKMVYLNLSHFFTIFDKVDIKGTLNFLHFVMGIDLVSFKRVFLEFNGEVQKKVVEHLEIPFSIIKDIIILGGKEVSEYLLKNDIRIKTLLDFPFLSIYKLAAKGINFSDRLLYEEEFVRTLSTMKDVKNYRLLLDNLALGNEVSHIELARKQFYEYEINNFDRERKMLKSYADCYNAIMNMQEINYRTIADLLNFYFSGFQGFNSDSEAYKVFISYSLDKDEEKLKRELQNESCLQLTNMIIDYTFEDVPYNVLLDLKQLISFQKGEGRQLTDEEIAIYNKVLQLDELECTEAIKLHNTLKTLSLGTIYDHFRNAKDKVASLISHVMLNENSIKRYKDDELSKLYGLDIYVLDGDEFYAFVCSLEYSKEFAISANDIAFTKDGYSFTLDHSSKLSTYRDPRDYYNLIYSSFPENQLVHVFPVDSYSYYNRYEYEHRSATQRVFEFNTPEELVKKSQYYNEIVLLMANKYRSDEVNSFLFKPQILGLYCFDEIVPNDIISARALDVGIVLVKTKNYKHDAEKGKNTSYDDIAYGIGADDFNYIDDVNSDDMRLRRQKKIKTR